MSGGEFTITGGNQACVGQPLCENVLEGIQGSESPYSKVLQGFDFGDGPRTKITQSARRSFIPAIANQWSARSERLVTAGLWKP